MHGKFRRFGSDVTTEPASRSESGMSRRRRAFRCALGAVVLGVIAFWLGGELQRSPAPAPAPRPRVVHVPSSQVLALPGKARPRLVLSGPRDLVRGQFLNAAPGPGAPDGFLLRVRSSRVNKGRTVVEVRPASLYEAVPSGELQVGPGGFVPVEPSHAHQQVGQGILIPARLLSGATNDAPWWSPGSLARELKCDGGGTLSLSRELQRSLTPYFDLQWQRTRSWRDIVKRVVAEINGTVSAEVKARAGGEMTCKVKPKEIPGPRITVPAQVGPVTVPVTFQVSLQISASASTTGEARVSASAGIGGSLGLEYRDRRTNAIKSFNAWAGLRPPPYLGAGASGDVLFGPVISISAGWGVPTLGRLAAEVRVDVISGVRLSYDIRPGSGVKTCIPLELGGQVILHLPLRRRLETKHRKLLKRELRCFPA